MVRKTKREIKKLRKRREEFKAVLLLSIGSRAKFLSRVSISDKSLGQSDTATE